MSLTSLVGLSLASAGEIGPQELRHNTSEVYSAYRQQTHQTLMSVLCEEKGGVVRVPVATLPILFTMPMPLQTRPNMVCLPSSQGVTASVMKNCA